jgi:hypothetical protein
MLDPEGLQGVRRPRHLRRELDEEGAYAIGRAYVEQFEPQRIAVGRDMRVHAPRWRGGDRRARGRRRGRARPRDGRHRDALLRGRRARLDGGVEVTASHNPKEYTGMKIVRRGALPVGGESGLLDVRDRRACGTPRDSPGAVVARRHLAGFVDACCRSSTSRRSSRCAS